MCNNFYKEITETNVLGRIYFFMEKVVLNFAITDTKGYLNFWKDIWENESLREVCPEIFTMTEIFLSESPANVFAESMGRIMNM